MVIIIWWALLICGRVWGDDLELARVHTTEEPSSRNNTSQHGLIMSYLDSIMSCREVSRLNVAVFTPDAVILRGFSQQEDASFTDRTPFCIGKIGRTFVSSLFGVLLDENQTRYPLKWDTKIGSILGDGFHFYDRWRSQEASIRDLLSDRLGYADYGFAWVVGLDFRRTSRDYCDKLWLLDPVADFRTIRIPSKTMMLLAICLLENLSGESFEITLKKKILEPLGIEDAVFMSPSNVSITTDANLSSPDTLCVSATDMLKWMKFHLLIGIPLTQATTMQDMHSPQIISASTRTQVRRPYFPVSNIQSAFGLGWNLGTYRGIHISFYRMLYVDDEFIGFAYSGEHGEVAATTSKVTVFVESNLAIYTSVITPTDEGTPINDVIHYYIADVMLGIPPWIDHNTACTYPAPWIASIPEPETPGARFKERVLSIQGPEAERQLELRRLFEQRLLLKHHFKYTGRFEHGFFGNISIYYANAEGRLFAVVGERGLGYLLAITAEIWMVELHSLDSQAPLIFQRNEFGRFQEIKALGYRPKAPPIFIRELVNRG